MGHFIESHLGPLRKSFIFSRRQRRQTGPVYLAIQTLRRLGGRQPLWGIGVRSLMPATSIPAVCSDRMAVSRPDPGPFTSTSTRRTPCSMARLAHASAASWAANGVDLREPLKPTLPADAHASTVPSGSLIEMMVLLNELLMCATP